MKRQKLDCDADGHSSIRASINRVPKTAANLRALVQKGCKECIEIFLKSESAKNPALFRDLVSRRAPLFGIQELIEAHPSVLFMANENGNYLIELAIRNKRTDVVQLVLSLKKNGARLSRRYFRDLLDVAICEGNLEVFKVILENDPALVNVLGPDNGNESKRLQVDVLHVAINAGQVEFVDYILDNFAQNINLDIENSVGLPAVLCVVARRLPVSTLKKLIAIKPNVMFIKPLLSFAFSCDNIDAFRMLIQDYGEKILPDKIERFRMMETVSVLLEKHSPKCGKQMSEILLDFVFTEKSLKSSPINLVEYIVMEILTGQNGRFAEIILERVYLSPTNSTHQLVQKAMTTLNLGDLTYGNLLLVLLHQEVLKGGLIESPMMTMALYGSRIILDHLKRTVFGDYEKLSVFYEIVANFTTFASFERFYMPPMKKFPESLVPRIYKVLRELSSVVNYAHIWKELYSKAQQKPKELKKWTESGFLQIVLALHSNVSLDQDDLADLYKLSKGEMIKFLTPQTQQALAIPRKQFSLKSLARFTILDRLSSICEEKRVEVLDRICSMEIPVTLKDYLCFLEGSKLKLFEYILKIECNNAFEIK